MMSKSLEMAMRVVRHLNSLAHTFLLLHIVSSLHNCLGLPNPKMETRHKEASKRIARKVHKKEVSATALLFQV